MLLNLNSGQLINFVHVGYAYVVHQRYLDLTSVRACLCSVCVLLCVCVRECLYFILNLPKDD